MKRGLMLLVFVCALARVVWPSEGPKGVPAPRIEGRWWRVAGNPMDHKYATGGQEPVDFAVWRAADGSWQLWSCIRNTTAGGKGGKTRFFYRWEGKNLTDESWKPMGIAMEADASVGETPGGLQAPHVVKVGDTYHMFLRRLGKYLPCDQHRRQDLHACRSTETAKTGMVHGRAPESTRGTCC